jgi:hypothetical protein
MPNQHTDADAAKAEIARARATERMRRSRNCRRMGLRCFTVQLRDSEIASLVRRGLLRPDEQTDRTAVIKAMHAFLDNTF